MVAERPDAYALRHAEWHGVPAVALRAGKSYLDLFDRALLRVLEEHSIDYVVVAGFQRIVGTETVQSYPDRIAKVHHSLLPEFSGPDPVADALNHGAKQTGVTVHLITRELEVGPIVSQQSLEIRDGETWHSLVERIHQLEVQLLPTAVLALIQWGEETFLDLVEHVALLSSGASILLLCMARPELTERRPTWPVTLLLEPLSEEDVDELIPERISGELRERIARAAGGNPLFVEEMLAMASDTDDEVVVPPTLKALLAARLDQRSGLPSGACSSGARSKVKSSTAGPSRPLHPLRPR